MKQFLGFIDSIMPVLFLVIFFSIFFYSNKQKRKALNKLSNSLTGSIAKFSFYPCFNEEYQGLKFSIVLIPATRNSPAYLRIHLIKNSFFKLRVYRESLLSRLGEKIGIVREIKINDEIFDGDFLIFSNKPTQGINYLNNSNIKDTIRDLFNSGFAALLIDGKKILIQKANYNLESDLEPTKATDTLQKLSLLARGL
jgi:hypothetical protein